ncbi:MAG: nucleotide exchange factor GrpE [Patescibacteria group bacterium]
MEDEIEILEDNAGFAEKLSKIKKDLEVCRQEKDEYLGGWKRAKADYMNAEREFSARLETTNQYAETRILKELLEVADGFDNAFALDPPESQWLEGVRRIYSQIEKIFSKYGVVKMVTKNSEFDPSIHEAVEVVKTDQEKDDNKVVGEAQAGYMMGDRVLRPARVKVSKYEK